MRASNVVKYYDLDKQQDRSRRFNDVEKKGQQMTRHVSKNLGCSVYALQQLLL
jgi:hypothetical protein